MLCNFPFTIPRAINENIKHFEKFCNQLGMQGKYVSVTVNYLMFCNLKLDSFLNARFIQLTQIVPYQYLYKLVKTYYLFIQAILCYWQVNECKLLAHIVIFRLKAFKIQVLNVLVLNSTILKIMNRHIPQYKLLCLNCSCNLLNLTSKYEFDLISFFVIYKFELRGGNLINVAIQR